MTSAELSTLETEHADAIAKAGTLEAARAEHLAAGETERRHRREQIWRSQLAQLEDVDTAADVAAARDQLAAAVRGESETSPVVALFGWLVAEKRAIWVAQTIRRTRRPARHTRPAQA